MQHRDMFGEIRSKLHHPSPSNWQIITQWVRKWPDARERDEVILPYCTAQLRAWPDRLRVAEDAWFESFTSGEDDRETWRALYSLARRLSLGHDTIALRQWRDEILDKTTITEDQIGEYSGIRKEIKEVTITTYQILTYRKNKNSDFVHFDLFNERNWGLIVYDEVHLLPAPVFRAVANLQSRRRLGLTATLVREDGREEEVFSLIGPKKYDVPWRVLEKQGFIASASCTEIRVPFKDDNLRLEYAVAEPRVKHKLAAPHPAKLGVVKDLLEEHVNDQVLIIGQYLDQLDELSELAEAPIITGRTPQSKREELYEKFRKKEVPVLVVSKVANFAVDLPDANVAIQVSGTFGSRQEEAQRLGRILRPKKEANEAYFYSVVTRDSTEQDYANKRQLFLTEQGYRYEINAAD